MDAHTAHLAASLAAPPSNLPPALLPVFFFLTSLFSNNVAFLVFRDGKFHWLVIHDDLLRLVKSLQSQIPLEQIDWRKVCDHFVTRIPHLPFYFGQTFIDVDWKNILFPRRVMKIKLPDGTIVIAKYLEHFGESWNETTRMNEHFLTFEIRGTSENVTIPLSDIITHVPTKSELISYDNVLEKKKNEEVAKAQENESAEASEVYKEQMIERGVIVSFPNIQRHYPNFSIPTLQVLFLLCRRFKIVPDFTYQFNLLVFRLLSLGDQSMFPFPHLSEEDQIDFEASKKEYRTKMVGCVIKSKTGRFQASSLPDHLRRLFEYHCFLFEIESPAQEDADEFLQKGETYFSNLVTNMSTTSGSALAFPDLYWTRSEFGVELRSSKNTMIQFLFKMPSSFPPDVFV
jgi:hypothetical protein